MQIWHYLSDAYILSIIVINCVLLTNSTLNLIGKKKKKQLNYRFDLPIFIIFYIYYSYF
jgi:hypothetical protein